MQQKTISIILCLSLFFSACHRDGGLENNARHYIKAMAEYEVSKAYPYATEETQKYTLDYFSLLLPKIDSSYIANNTPATITIDSIVHNNDTTATVFFHKKTPIQPRVNAELQMRLRNGKWLAHQVIQPAPLMGYAPDTNSFQHPAPHHSLDTIGIR